jgi:type IV fimbrial biogenesis protein FimT
MHNYSTRRLTSHGFTLIEIIVTIALVAVLSGLAGPAFREYLGNQRIKSASFDLMSAISFARSEAIKRNADVRLCASSTNWAAGWSVKIGAADCSGTTVLRTQDAYNGIVIEGSSTTLSYSNDGRPAASSTFDIKLPTTISGVRCRRVTTDLIGTPRSVDLACS